jgi:ferredoxin
MGTAIYYFSGTGNSLHAARELAKRLGDAKLIPIAGLLDQDTVKTQAETVGFAFPVYLMSLPGDVRAFLTKLDLASARYIFSVETRGISLSLADIQVNRLVGKKGRRLDAAFALDMGNNSPTGIRPAPGNKNWPDEIAAERIAELETHVQDRLAFMRDIIANKDRYRKRGILYPFRILIGNLFLALSKKIKAQIEYKADDTCTGCGICERVCLSGRIKMTDGKPLWRDDVTCRFCFACFNYCPRQSILIGQWYTAKEGRYHHPDVSAQDIAAQKEVRV